MIRHNIWLVRGTAFVIVNCFQKYNHIVTKSISGKSSELSIGYQSKTFSKDHSFIICSDGLHDVISIEQLLVFINQKNGLQELKRQILKEAQDNYSIITITF